MSVLRWSDADLFKLAVKCSTKAGTLSMERAHALALELKIPATVLAELWPKAGTNIVRFPSERARPPQVLA